MADGRYYGKTPTIHNLRFAKLTLYFGSGNADGIPLKAYGDLKAFELFLVDVGLLGCMVGLRQRTLLDGNDLFVEFKGALAEQYVCQQLKTYQERFAPEIAVRASMADFKKEDRFVNLPLYASEQIADL